VLATAGTHTDTSLRAHELFRPDAQGAARRQARYIAATVAAVVVLAGAGIAFRISIEGADRYAARMGAQAMHMVQLLRYGPPPPPIPAAKARAR
jgi:hypothetical protein